MKASDYDISREWDLWKSKLKKDDMKDNKEVINNFQFIAQAELYRLYMGSGNIYTDQLGKKLHVTDESTIESYRESFENIIAKDNDIHAIKEQEMKKNDKDMNEDMSYIQRYSRTNNTAKQSLDTKNKGFIASVRKPVKNKYITNIVEADGSPVNPTNLRTDNTIFLNNGFSIREVRHKLENDIISFDYIQTYITTAEGLYYNGKLNEAKKYIYYTLVLKQLYKYSQLQWYLENIYDNKSFELWDFFQSLNYTNIDYRNQGNYNMYSRTSKQTEFDNDIRRIKNSLIKDRLNLPDDFPVKEEVIQDNSPYGIFPKFKPAPFPKTWNNDVVISDSKEFDPSKAEFVDDEFEDDEESEEE